MPVSNYWADVEVEVAFDSGFSTAAVDRTWTDVSDYVDSDQAISINFGRTDERSQADANTLSLTLSNGDGRFTPGRSGSPYYPDVRLYRPIRVTATPPGGAASVRFTGYVTAWNPGWPDGTDAWSTVQVTASSRLQRLGLADQRRSVIEETLYAGTGTVAGYYILNEAAEATTAADSSGNGLAALARFDSGTAVVFGTAIGPPTDGYTAAQFNHGQALVADYSPDAVIGPDPWLSAFFLSEVVPTTSSVGIASFGLNPRIRLGLDAAGHVEADAAVDGTLLPLLSPSTYADGSTHHAFIGVSQSGVTVTADLYVDGVLVDTASDTGTGTPISLPADQTLVGHALGGVAGEDVLQGVLAHVAFGSGWTAGLPADLAAAGTTAFASESSADRLERYASWVGVPAAETSATGTARTVLSTDPTGASIVDLMRTLEATEQGAMFDAPDGTLTLLGPEDRYLATSAFTLDMAEQRVGNDYAPVYEPSDIINDATVTQTGDGGAVARVVDTASRDDYGVATSSTDIVSTDDNDPAQLAAWQIHKYAEPRTRVPNVTVAVPEFVGGTPDCDDILAATIGTLITVDNRPSQDETTSADLFIEGYTEVIGGVGVHTISFNVSSADVDQNVWVLGDPVRGELDAGYVLSY